MPDLATLAQRARTDNAVVVPAPLAEIAHRARARRRRKRVVAGAALSLTLVALVSVGLVSGSRRGESTLDVIDQPGTSTPAPPTTVPTTSPTPTTTPVTTMSPVVTTACENIGFTPNTDDVAGSIMATGLTCPEASAFVRNVHSIEHGDAFSLNGFACTSVEVEGAQLAARNYTCVAGNQKVTWRKT